MDAPGGAVAIIDPSGLVAEAVRRFDRRTLDAPALDVGGEEGLGEDILTVSTPVAGLLRILRVAGPV